MTTWAQSKRVAQEGAPKNRGNAGKGRPRGVPNHATTRARNAFTETWQRLTPDIEDWIRRTAEGEPVPMVKKDPATGQWMPVLDQAGNPIMVRQDADPGRAAEILIKIAEYHVPKLGRLEHVGEGRGAITVKVVKYGEDK